MKEVKLEKLVESIGVSIQKAQKAIESQTVDLYFQEYQAAEDQPDRYAPVTRQIQLPTNNALNAKEKIVEVPLTALYNHNAIMLDSVDIQLKFVASEKDGELYLDVQSNHEPDETRTDYSEMSLHFKKADSSEGIARLTDQTVKLL